MAQQISQKMICPGVSRCFQVDGWHVGRMVRSLSTAASIVAAISAGCDEKRKNVLSFGLTGC
jgi:hypothetical protein